MIHFNHQEKIFLLSLCCALFAGASLQLAFKKYPFLSDIVHVIDSPYSYPKVNVNKAGVDELVRIPYIGEYTANQIIAYRQQTGGFQSLEDLKRVKGIRIKNFERFRNYLKLN